VTLFARIPKVDRILEWDGIKSLLILHPRPTVLAAVRTVLDSIRSSARSGLLQEEDLSERAVTARIDREVALASAFSLRRVVNGTGVVIHTNLGRSPLSKLVKPLLDEIAFGYSNLEFDLEKGERGSRYSHVERLLCELTGSEAALVVNNNAAAVLLALSALGAGKEVVVSRGELVEIGGSSASPMSWVRGRHSPGGGDHQPDPPPRLPPGNHGRNGASSQGSFQQFCRGRLHRRGIRHRARGHR